MRFYRTFGGRLGASLVAWLAFSLWIGVAGAAEGQERQSSPEPQRSLELSGIPIEQVDVTGRRSRLSLRFEVVDAERRMFDLFNQLNDVREFTISCETILVTGTRIPERECVPLYMKRARITGTQDFLWSNITCFQGCTSVTTTPFGAPQNEEDLRVGNQHKHDAFNAKFRELALQHPALATEMLDLQAKREQLQEQEEALQRTGQRRGLLRGLFSRSGDDDIE